MSTPAQVWQYRTLVGNLALRELRSRYKKSVVGWGWSLINPAVSLGIYTLVFGYFLKGTAPLAGNGHTSSFALWLFAALVVWNAFSGGINDSIQSFLGSGGLLTRTYFPPECPVVAGSTTVAIQTGLETAILLGFMIAIGNMGWTFLLVAPILVLVTALALGLGMIVSLLNVRYRDVNYLVGIGLQIMFYGTPIVYRLDLIPQTIGPFDTSRVLGLNPMTHFVDGMRKVTYLQEVPTLGNWAAMVVSALLALAAGWTFFGAKAPQYIEEL
jgi:ABC-type polysaccharide/polyol phosphate export permease